MLLYLACRVVSAVFIQSDAVDEMMALLQSRREVRPFAFAIESSESSRVAERRTDRAAAEALLVGLLASSGDRRERHFATSRQEGRRVLHEIPIDLHRDTFRPST